MRDPRWDLPKGHVSGRRIGNEAEEARRAKTLEKNDEGWWWRWTMKEGWWRRISAVLRKYWQTYWGALELPQATKNLRASAEDTRDSGFNPWVRKAWLKWLSVHACTATSVHLKSPCLPGKGSSNNPASLTGLGAARGKQGLGAKVVVMHFWMQ